MNATSATSAANAPMIALNTKAEGSSLCNISKPDAIAETKTRLAAILRSLLECAVGGYVLTRGKSEAQAAAICLRCEAPDLIYLRKIFCADSEKHIPSEFSFQPMHQRNTEPSLAGGFPVKSAS